MFPCRSFPAGQAEGKEYGRTRGRNTCQAGNSLGHNCQHSTGEHPVTAHAHLPSHSAGWALIERTATEPQRENQAQPRETTDPGLC